MSLAKYTPDKNKLLPAIWNILTTNMVKDKSHNGNLATGWKVTSNPEGKFGGSLVFDHPERYKEYLWCGKHTDWIQSKGTFAFWVKTAEQNVDMDVLDLWEVPYTDIFIVMVNKQNKVWFTVKEANNKLISLTSKKAMDAPGWHHVVITQDGSGAKIYIDGELSETSGKNSAEWTNTLNMHHFPKFNDAYNSAGCYLGNSHWTKFRGELDEVYFLNRALSAEEVQQLHQNTLKNKEGLLIHWSFDDLLDVKKMEHKDLYYGPRDYYNKNPPKLVEQYFPDKSKTMLIALPVFALGSS